MILIAAVLHSILGEDLPESKCGQLTKAPGASFWSENFQFGRSNYPANVYCNWTFQAPHPEEHVVLLFADYFGLESGRMCPNDYLSVYDGPDKNSPIMGRYCGIMRPPNMISSRDSLFVEFVSDSSRQGIGFMANMGMAILGEHSLNSPDNCGGYIMSEEGVISSPNYPNLYGNDRMCIWRIAINPLKKIIVTIEHLDIEISHKCQRDSLTITSIAELKKRQVGKYCGNLSDKGNVINTESNDLIIVFNSDLAGSHTGFKLFYSTETSGSACSGVTDLTDATGRIESVTVDRAYNRMLTCNWLIKVEENHIIEIGIESLNSDSDCTKDSLSIYDGVSNSDREIARVCGETVTKIFTSTSNEMYLIWHIDTPSIEKQVIFTYKQKMEKPPPALIRITPTTTVAPKTKTINQRIVTPSPRPANSKHPNLPSRDMCAKCSFSTTLNRSKICAATFVLQIRVISVKEVKEKGKLWKFFMVKIITDWRLGPLSFRKTKTSTKTRIFASCSNCPPMKKRETYLIAGLHTKDRGLQTKNALLDKDDFIMLLPTHTLDPSLENLVKSYTEEKTCL